MKKLLLLLFILIPLWCGAASRTYFISPLGSNTAPYETWAKAATSANSAVTAGQSVAPTGTGYGEGHTYYIAPSTYTDDYLVLTSANNSGATVIGTTAHGSTTEGLSSQIIITNAGHTLDIGANQTLKHLTLINTAAGEWGMYGTTGHSCVGTDIVIKDSAGYGLGCSDTADMTINRLSLSNCTSLPIVGGGTLTINTGLIYNNRSYMDFEGGTFVGNNLTIVGNDAEAVVIPAWSSAATSVTLNNPIIIANSTAARNKYILDNKKAGATLAVNNAIWLPNGLVVDRATDYRTNGATINEASVSKIPRFRAPNKKGILVIGLDDTTNLAHAQTIAAKLEAYGYKGTFAFDATLATSEDKWGAIAALANAGHEISSHTMSHSGLTSLDGIDITYDAGESGATAATVTITSNTLTATVTGAAHGFEIDLAANGKISDIINLINATHGSKSDGATWTAAKHGTWDATVATNLADITTQDCFNTPLHMQLDQTRYFAYEITGSKSTIEAQVKAAGGAASFTVNTLVHPGDYTSADTRTAIRAAGYTGARGDYQGDWNMTTGVRPFYLGDGLADNVITHSNVEANTAALLELLNWSGGVRFLFTHDFATVTESDWDIILTTIKQSNITVMTLAEAVAWMTANGTASGDDGEIAYTVAQTAAADLRLKAGSPAINAGVDVGLTTDYAGRAIRGVPDIGAYEYYGVTGGMLMGLGVGF